MVPVKSLFNDVPERAQQPTEATLYLVPLGVHSALDIWVWEGSPLYLPIDRLLSSEERFVRFREPPSAFPVAARGVLVTRYGRRLVLVFAVLNFSGELVGEFVAPQP